MSGSHGARRPGDLACVCVIGLGLGWLMGMSASPVLSVVLTALLGATAGILSAFLGMTGEAPSPDSKEPHLPRRHRADPLPLALLIVFLICGSVFGVRARVNEWLGPGPAEVAKRWQAAGLPMTKPAIIQRLFERDVAASSNVAGTQPGKPWLFQADAALCGTLKRDAGAAPMDGALLRHDMQHSGEDVIKQFADQVEDPKALKAAVDVFICPNSTPQ